MGEKSTDRFNKAEECIGRERMKIKHTKELDTGTSLLVQRLRLCLPIQEVLVQSLAGELSSPMPCGPKTKNVTNSFKTFKMVHIKKKIRYWNLKYEKEGSSGGGQYLGCGHGSGAQKKRKRAGPYKTVVCVECTHRQSSHPGRPRSRTGVKDSSPATKCSRNVGHCNVIGDKKGNKSIPVAGHL